VLCSRRFVVSEEALAVSAPVLLLRHPVFRHFPSLYSSSQVVSRVIWFRNGQINGSAMCAREGAGAGK
jgi:hypothetical protein